MDYSDSTPSTLYREFLTLENAIGECGRNIKRLATAQANAVADYEEKKNIELISMFDEEASDKFKRTVDQRHAAYRTKYEKQRRVRGLADAELSSERDLLKALTAQLSGLQSRKGLVVLDWKHSEVN